MKKPKTFRPWNPEQTLLLPPSPVEWLPEHHLVFFLLDMAAELDLSAIYAVYEARDPRGVKAYDPRMMVVLLLYAYCVGIPSSRRIERACWEDAAFRVLTGNQQPTTAGSVISASFISMPWRACLCRCCGCARRRAW
jgi:Transposase and inactivated derivatives